NHDSPFEARRRENRPGAVFAESRKNVLMRFGRDIGDIFFREFLFCERRRLQWKYLLRPSLLARDVGCGRVSFLDAKYRFACCAIQDEHMACLRYLRHGFNPPPILAQAHDEWEGRQIVIEQVVANHLKVPEALAGTRVQSQNTIREEILAFPVASVEIECGRAEPGENDSFFRIETETAPCIRAAAILP